MKKWLGMDSPIMQFLGKMTDLVVLNFLAVLCAIPIFTIGASAAALYSTVYRLDRDEGYLYRKFFQAFKENFRQATILWMIILAVGVILGLSLWTYVENGIEVFTILSVLSLLILTSIATWLFPLQSHFYNSVGRTLKNAFLCSVGFLPRTLLMVAINIAPLVLAFTVENAQNMILLYLLVWFSLAAEWNLRLLRRPFLKMETLRTQGCEGEDPNT